MDSFSFVPYLCRILKVLMHNIQKENRSSLTKIIKCVHFWYNFYLLFLNSERVAEQHSCIQEKRYQHKKLNAILFPKKGGEMGGFLGLAMGFSGGHKLSERLCLERRLRHRSSLSGGKIFLCEMHSRVFVITKLFRKNDFAE